MNDLVDKIKKEIRQACNVKGPIKIKFIETNDPPDIRGQKFEKSYNRWRHSYKPSTRRIEVGLGSAILLPYVAGNEKLQKILLAL